MLPSWEITQELPAEEFYRASFEYVTVRKAVGGVVQLGTNPPTS